jgi:hypothetical protein
MPSSALFDQLQSLRLPAGSYAIFGSGPLAIRGIIPSCNDLDVLCKEDAWKIVSRIGTTEFLPEYGVSVVALADSEITFGTSWGIGDFDIEALIDSAEVIDGLPFVLLEHVIRYKTIRSSPKDRRHLDALKSSGVLS